MIRYNNKRKVHYENKKEIYHYYCDCSDQWTTEENEKYQSQWNEIIQMLNEAKEELKNISLIQEEKD